MKDALAFLFLIWLLASSFYGTGVFILNLYQRYERRKNMNIDVLDEDGASNIAHPESYGKEKTVYWGKSPVAQTKTYPICESDVSNNGLDVSKQTSKLDSE